MPFGDPAGGIGLCYKETVPYKCWELGLKGRVRGVWAESTRSRNKSLNSERCSKANGLFCLCNIRMAGRPDVCFLNSEVKGKANFPERTERWEPVQRKKKRHSHGEWKTLSELRYRQPQGTPLNWQIVTPSWHFSGETKKSHWLAGFSKSIWFSFKKTSNNCVV